MKRPKNLYPEFEQRPDSERRPAQRGETWADAISSRCSIFGISICSVAIAFVVAGCDRSSKRAAVPEFEPPAQKVITTPGGLTMAPIPAGEFEMGDNRGDPDERPAHKVRVSAFYMDTHEVTQKAYEALMQQNPSRSKGPDRPVEQVDWYHGALFCNMRSLKEGLKPCYDSKTLACDFNANGYRLPTEAEWEYACRAGTGDRFSFGNDEARLKNCAWFKANAGQATHPVGQKTANPWGLYDMHGNVAEWCHDFYSETFYSSSPAGDPHGPASGEKCVLRGGSWRTAEDGCRSSARNSETPRFADACFGSDACGFRCVRSAK
jgi:formylglycine-generating enzyme required for sulfatase activity